MPWLEVEVRIRRRNMAEPAFAVIDVTEMDDAPDFKGIVLTESFTMELPRMVPDDALEVFAASAIGQAWATFRFNRSIRKLPEKQRRELQPPLFGEDFST